jgi:tetratricopeptide (TPR) repeat protein
MMKRRNLEIVFTLISIFLLLSLFTQCAHKKAYKRALELEKSGQYLAAAEQDLMALDKKSNFTDAREHLNIIAPRAYQELLSTAENFERNSQWLEAIDSWTHMEVLLSRFQRHNIHVTATDVRSRLARAKETGTSYYYNQGQRYFMGRQYEEAATNFSKVMKISGNYLDTRNKLWESLVNLGDQKLRMKDYASSIQFYQASLNYTDNHESSNQLIANAYYQWAEQYMTEKNYREATEKFESVLQVDPGYRDAKYRREDAFQKAVKRIAILPFQNISTSRNDKYSNMLTDLVLNDCINAKLKYAIFINRANLDLILEEHKLAMAGVLDASKAAEIGKLEGIHYFVTGSITQINMQDSPTTYVTKSFDKVYTIKDTAGNSVQKTETDQYLEYTSSRNVQLTVSFQMVEVETGRYLMGENYTENASDAVNWIHYKGNINDLPKDIQSLVKPKAEPKSGNLLTSDAMQGVTNKIAAKLVDFFK